MPNDEERERAADELDTETDALELAMSQRRDTLATLAKLERVGQGLLTIAEEVAIGALKAAISGALK